MGGIRRPEYVGHFRRCVASDGQTAALRRGLDLVIATPGRLLDLMQQGHVDLAGVEVFVLDEADRMLDMGLSTTCGESS